MGIHERKEREREGRMAAILDSARNAFAKFGIDHCTMDMIAKEAELSKGTLYLYYRNRNELLLGLVAEDFESVVLRVEKVVSGKLQPDAKLLKAGSLIYEFSKDHFLFYKAITQLDLSMLLSSKGCEQSVHATHFQEFNERMVHALTTVVEEGIASGMFVTDKSARQIVVQMLMALKGVLVVSQNQMFPPAWGKLNTKALLLDTARLMIKGLKCKPILQG